MGRRRWGEELIGGFSSPHTLLPKEEKEEKNAFCVVDSAKKVPLNGSGAYFHEKFLSTWGKSI
jgi:hypothetical protein